MNEILIEMTNIKKVFSGVVAIEGIDFDLRSGEVHALMGENGAGKSTLAKIIAGIHQADGGQMKVKGKVEDFASVREAVDHGVSIVTQEFSSVPDLSIAENIFLSSPKYYKGGFLQDKKAMVADTYELLKLFGMEQMIDPRDKMATLSVAQMQVIEILKAVSTKANVIILDEPTVGLDPAQVIEIRRLIRELGKSHTVILSSHILSEVQAVCSQVLILSKGHLVAVGAPEQLAEKLNPGSRLRATVLGGGKTVLKTVGSIPGIRKVEIESEADGQVTFTAESVDASDRRAEVSRALSQAGCTVLALAAENRTLEEVFLALTENESETPSDEGEEKTE